MVHGPRCFTDLLHIPLLFSMGAIWSGCSFQMPISVVDIQTREETTPAERTPPEGFDLRLHSDGLGWQVKLRRTVITTVSIRGKERWRYRLYDIGGGRHRTADNTNFDDVCAIGVMVSPLLAPLDVGHPPYWSRWDRIIPACLRRANTGGAVYEPHERLFRTYRRLQLEPVTEGHVALTWSVAGHDPVHVLIPLADNSLEHGIDVRLRWLAELLQRTGLQPTHSANGRVELQWIHEKRILLRRPLSVMPRDMTDALRDDRMVAAPPSQWPSHFVVRIECSRDILSELERAHLLSRTALLLHHLHVPVVLRGQELEELQHIQATMHLPSYADELRIEVGRMSGATALLHLDVQQPYDQARALTISLVNIETGELLAKVASDGHSVQWPYIIEATVMQLGSALQNILPHVPVTGARTRPLLNEGRP